MAVQPSSGAPWLVAGERRESTQHSIAMAEAVTSPNYFPAPGFISNPSINSDQYIYPHLSQIRHRDTDDANVVGLSSEGSLQSLSSCSEGGRTPAIFRLARGKQAPC